MASPYDRRKGTDDSGCYYERDMSALVALRLYNNYDEFHLASNLDKCGALDDLVFSARKGQNWNTYFVQLKHRTSTNKIPLEALRAKTKGFKKFFIAKYLESFIEIQKMFKKGEGVIFEHPLSSAKFYLFTNGLLDNDVLELNHPHAEIDLLSTNASEEVNFKLESVIDAEIINQWKNHGDCAVKQFTHQFYICSGQVNESNIDKLVDEEINKARKLSVNEVDILRLELYQFVHRMHKEGDVITYRSISDLFTETDLYAQPDKKNVDKIKFTQPFLKEFKNDLAVNDKLILLTCMAEKTLLCIAALKQLKLMDKLNLMISLQYLETDEFSNFISVWQAEKLRTLIIDCEKDTFNLNQRLIATHLRMLCKENPNNQIILVAPEDHTLARKIVLQQKGSTVQRFNCTLKDLDEEYKKRMFKCQIKFQGYDTPLSTLFPDLELAEEVFDMNAMKNVLTGKCIEVGNKPVDPNTNYVPRILNRKTVSSAVFSKSPPGNIFAVSGITVDEADKSPIFKNIKISTSSTIVLNDNGSKTKEVYILEGSDLQLEFNKLLSMKTNIHWLRHKTHKKASLWCWQQSTGYIELIVNNLTKNLEYLEFDTVMATEDKMVVVSAESGMGKTTLVNNLAAQTKKLCQDMWVITVQLNAYSSYLFDNKFSNDIKTSVRNIIAKAAGVDSTVSNFNTRLFNHCYNVTGNIIVLLDGFDEISPSYTEKGIQFLTTLQESLVSRILVTTRPVWAKRLQTETSTLGFSIPPLNEREQRKFLENFCKQTNKNDKSEQKDFSIKVLKLISKSFGKGHNEFAGNPLHLKMVAEEYDQTQNLPMQINNLQLFENFVNKKIYIIFDENDILKFGKEDLHKNFEKKLKELALLTLLPLETCSTLEPPIDEAKYEKLKKYVLDGKEKAGFVVSFPARSPQFIHRAFAEYFVARFLVKRFQNNRNLIKSEDFFSPSFNFVQDFLNRMLAKGEPIHEEVMQGKLSSNINDIKKELDSQDKGGRTALHVAAALPKSKNAIDTLLEAGADPDIADDVLEWNPVDYAIRLKHFENIGPLLERSQPRSEVRTIVPTTWESLRMAISGDYKELLLYLLENDIISKVSKEGTQYLSNEKWLNNESCDNLTLLHVAAWHNASKILKYLLRADNIGCKVQIECRDGKQRTPLLLAVCNRRLEAVGLLVEANANLLVTTEDKKDIMLLTFELRDEEMLICILMAMKSQEKYDKYFKKSIAQLVGDKSSWGLQMLQFLLILYPELNHATTDKGVPLIIAASIKGNEDAVAILSKVADVNVVHRSSTSLHYATRGGRLEVVKVLLQCPGINVNVIDDKGETPHDVAKSKRKWVIADLLNSYESGI